jgi:hypothetical protein
MKRQLRFAMVVCSALAMTGCGPAILRAQMPMSDRGGTLVLELTHRAYDLTVTINGRAVARRAKADRLEVTGVPPGKINLEIAMGGVAKERIQIKRQLSIAVGKKLVIPVASPKISDGAWINSGLSMLSMYLLLAAMLIAI